MKEHHLKLNVLENSQAFLIEAVSKAIVAENDARNWQFAILNLVQSLELSLKSILAKKHPLFLYENIDNPKHTVSVTKAIERLENPMIGGVKFSEKEKKGMSSAIKLRNDITHHEFDFSVEYAKAQFLRVFGLIVHMFRHHFDIQITDYIDSNFIESLLEIEKSRVVLIEHANTRMQEEGVDSSLVWECSNCLCDSFVADKSKETCYVCGYQTSVEECGKCEDYFYSHDLRSIEHLFETDFCEGQTIVHNSFGYEPISICSDCYVAVQRDIDEQWQQRIEEDEYYHWSVE